MNKDLRFKFARQVSGYTQQGLAEAAGCRESLIARIESGRATPTRELSEKLAKLLNKPTFELGFQ